MDCPVTSERGTTRRSGLVKLREGKKPGKMTPDYRPKSRVITWPFPPPACGAPAVTLPSAAVTRSRHWQELRQRQRVPAAGAGRSAAAGYGQWPFGSPPRTTAPAVVASAASPAHGERRPGRG